MKPISIDLLNSLPSEHPLFRTARNTSFFARPTATKPRRRAPRVPASELYRKHADVFLGAGEQNFCVPMAVGLVLGLDPMKVDRAFKVAGIRKAGGRMRRRHWLDWLASVAVDQTSIPDARQRGALTAISAPRAFPTGRYILEFSGHVAAMIDGVVHDWTVGRRNQLLHVRKLEVLDHAMLAPLR